VFIIEKILLSFVIGGTWFTFLIGSWHISLTILLVFMAIDIVTGVIHSAIERKVSSKIAYRGFLKKATIMLVIIVANLLDLLTVGGVPVFRTMAIFFYIGMEGISITENLTKIGVPLPRAMTKYIEQLSKEETTDRKD
jgi:toxin secretion/phage lysis holin